MVEGVGRTANPTWSYGRRKRWRRTTVIVPAFRAGMLGACGVGEAKKRLFPVSLQPLLHPRVNRNALRDLKSLSHV